MLGTGGGKRRDYRLGVRVLLRRPEKKLSRGGRLAHASPGRREIEGPPKPKPENSRPSSGETRRLRGPKVGNRMTQEGEGLYDSAEGRGRNRKGRPEAKILKAP